MRLYRYRAQLVRVVDGDTVGLRIDLGCDVLLAPLNPTRYVRCRLHGVEAPELKDAGGPEAASWLRDRLPAGIVVWIRSRELDKWRRPVVEIWSQEPSDDESEPSVNREIVLAGLATEV